jgi:hypothetical protein
VGAFAGQQIMEQVTNMGKSNANNQNTVVPSGHEEIFGKLTELYQELFQHNGYGALRVEMRFLKKGQKEIFVISGKEYRFVVDYPTADTPSDQCPGVTGGGDESIKGKNRKTVKAEKEVAKQ